MLPMCIFRQPQTDRLRQSHIQHMTQKTETVTASRSPTLGPSLAGCLHPQLIASVTASQGAGVRRQRIAPAAIAGNVAALLLDVDTHKLPNAVAAPQLPKGCSKADWLAVNAQDRSVQDHQRCSPAQSIVLDKCCNGPSGAVLQWCSNPRVSWDYCTE